MDQSADGPRPKYYVGAPAAAAPLNESKEAEDEKKSGLVVRTVRHRRNMSEPINLASHDDALPSSAPPSHPPDYLAPMNGTGLPQSTSLSSLFQPDERGVVVAGKLTFEERVDHWKERHFVLFDSKLSYVRKRYLGGVFSDDYFKDLILLHEVQEVCQDDTCFLIDEKCFLVRTAKKTFYFKSQTVEEVEDWMAAIRATAAVASRGPSRPASRSSSRASSSRNPTPPPSTAPPMTPRSTGS